MKKHNRIKLFSILGLSLLTSFGVISGVSFAKNNVNEVSAGTTQEDSLRVWIYDENCVGAVIQIWSVDYGNSGYTEGDLIKWFTDNKEKSAGVASNYEITKETYGNLTIKNSSFISGRHYEHGDSVYGQHRCYQFPHYVKGFTFNIGNWNRSYYIGNYNASRKNTEFYAFWCNNNNCGTYDSKSYTDWTYDYTTYNITKKYSLSGQTGDTIGTDNYYAYSYYKKSSAPSNPYGYTFSKWTSDLAGNNEIGDTQTFSSNSTIYAYCTANTTTVTLDSQGGTGGSTSVTATYGSSMPSITKPTKTGYTFNGYYDATSGGKPYYNASGESAATWDKDSSTATLYAQWTVNTHTLSWVTDGDPLTGNYTSGTVAYGTTIVQPNTPTKSGYSFGGWTPSVPQTMPDNDLTLTATWVQNSVTATFVDGDGVTIHTQTVEKGAAFSYTGPTPTKTATAQYTYDFTGWNPELGPINVDTTFTAQFTAVTREYNITWIDGNGSTLGTSSVAYGTTPTYPSTLPTPTKEPSVSKTYTFNGNWSPTPVPVTGEASYTAQFDEATRQYTLAWNLNGGEVPDRSKDKYTKDGTYDYGTTITAPIVAKDGYVFNGWNPTFNSTLTGNTTYTAQWNRPSAYVLHNYTTHEVLPLTHNTLDNQWELKGFYVSVGDTFKVENWYSGGSTADQYYGFEQADQSQGGSAWESSQIVDDEGQDHNFKVNYAGSYDLYFHDTWGSNKIWIPKIAMEDNYKIKVTSGFNETEYNLVKESGEGKTDNQLVTNTKVSVFAGDVITVYNGNIELDSYVAKATGNNNCYNNSNNEIEVICDMLDYSALSSSIDNSQYIYVDTSAKNVFCHGFEAGTHYMVITHSDETINYVKLLHNETPIDPRYNEFYSPEEITFFDGDLITFVNATSDGGKTCAQAWKVADVDDASLSFAFKTSDDGSIICETDQVDGIPTRTYLKIGQGDIQGTNSVYFGNKDIEQAINFAKEFNSKISAVCNADGHTVEKDLKDKWDEMSAAYTKMLEDYEDVADSIVIILSDSTGTYISFSDLSDFYAKYDYVYAKHVSWGLDNFAKRNVTPVSSSHMLSFFNSENISFIIAVVSIISIISVSAIGAYFYLRKRKED